MNGSLGKIINIDGNYVTIKIGFNLEEHSNLMNVHVVFEDGTKTIVGEILRVTVDELTVGVVGEIVSGVFVPGVSSKPAFSSVPRMIRKDELALILGPEEIQDSDHLYLGKSSI